jgi:hypothetical protein
VHADGLMDPPSLRRRRAVRATGTTLFINNVSRRIHMQLEDYRTLRKSTAAAPESMDAAGVSEPDLPSTIELLTSAVVGSPPPLRARLLQRLLAPVGPLALAVVARGAFAKYVDHSHWPRPFLTIDQVTRITSDQVSDLVRYVAQSDPTLLEQIMHMV